MAQAPVERPQRSAVEERTREEMDVHPSDPAAAERALLDEGERVFVIDDLYDRQLGQGTQDGTRPCQRAQCDFADDEWMTHDLTLMEELGQAVLSTAKVLYPD